MEYNGFKIEHMGTFNLYTIKNKQGPIPKVLNGNYTSRPEAMKAIDSYLATKKKGSPNGSAKESGNS